MPEGATFTFEGQPVRIESIDGHKHIVSESERIDIDDGTSSIVKDGNLDVPAEAIPEMLVDAGSVKGEAGKAIKDLQEHGPDDEILNQIHSVLEAMGVDLSKVSNDEARRVLEGLGQSSREASEAEKFVRESTPKRIARNFKKAREAVKKFVLGKKITNKETGWVATVSRNALDKMLNDSAVKKSVSPSVHSMAVANVDELFEHAVLGRSHPDREGNPDIKSIHRFYAPMIVDDHAVAVKLTVKEFTDEKQGKRIYSVESIKIETPAGDSLRQGGELELVESNSQSKEASIRPAGVPDIIADKVRRFNSAAHDQTDPASLAGVKDPAEIEKARKAWIEQGTDSPYFKDWFGESKATEDGEAGGKPLVVYHGTADDIKQFDISRQGKNTGAESAKGGFFFTDSARTAESYANYAATDTRVAAILAEADKAEARGDWDEYDAKLVEAEQLEASFRYSENRKGGQNVIPVYLSLKNPMVVDAHNENAVGFDISATIKRAKQDGHDGVIIHNLDDAVGLINEDATHYIVFDPHQIKSATDNRGTFDINNPDIRYQDAGKVRRGAFHRSPSGKFFITLFEKNNLSTVAHEGGHAFLEMMSDLLGCACGYTNLLYSPSANDASGWLKIKQF